MVLCGTFSAIQICLTIINSVLKWCPIFSTPCRLRSLLLCHFVLCNRSSSEAGGSTEFGSPHHHCHMRDTHFTLAVHRAGNVADYPSQLEVSVWVQMFDTTLAPPTLHRKDRNCAEVNVDIGEPPII